MGHFILSAFGDEISPHLDEQVQILKAHGISHLEFRNLENQVIIDYSLPQVKEIYRRLADLGIAVSALGSPIGKIAVTDPFPSHLERFKKALAVADALHTRYIRMFSFYIPAGADPALYRDEVLERWGQFIAMTEGTDFILLHENEKAIYGDTAGRCLDLLQTLNNERVKAVFDPANFVQCGEQTYPYALSLLRKHVVYLHIKDALYRDQSVVPAGHGDAKIREILQCLEQDGFSGFLSIEPHLDNSLPGGGPERFSIAVNALKDILITLHKDNEAHKS